MIRAFSSLASCSKRAPSAARFAQKTPESATWLLGHLHARLYTSGPKPSQVTVKPKSQTPLRRSAPSESLPIRSNPTPTRSDIQPISTLATAERYMLMSLRTRLLSEAHLLHDALWVPRWCAPGTEREGELFIFENGSFVGWGLTEEDVEKFRKQVLVPAAVEIAPLAEPETEELEFVTDPSEATRLQGDLVILGQQPEPSDPETAPVPMPASVLPAETVLARYAFSQALSRSTALSALEVGLEEHLTSMSGLPSTLMKAGRPGMSRRALIRKLGELLKFRQGLNLNRGNFFDTPDFYWAEPVLEGYFNSLSNALEVKARIRGVNEKITYAAEMQSVLRQLLTETSASRMELIIILLIAVEVVIVLVRDVPEFFQEKEDERHNRTPVV